VSSSESAPVADPGETLESLLRSSGRGRCHIPAPLEEGARCGVQADLRRKPVVAVPPAHREWCQRCLALWREVNTTTGV
jgi:hypothetical protein